MTKKNPHKKGGMFEGALHIVFENAKKNRNQPTAAETVLWMYLREGINGIKFRRQHPIGLYIADFYCHQAKLVIEVDGRIHQQADIKLNDEEKETYLANLGYTIRRFTNEQVMNKCEEVLSKIKKVHDVNIPKQTSHLRNESLL